MASSKRSSADAPTYGEGTWFCVPLRDATFAVGIIARASSRGGILLGYFFGPRVATVPSLESLTGLLPGHAFMAARFGDLGLMQGRWPIIGKSAGWTKKVWPMPSFGRVNPLDGRGWRVTYADDDPSGRPHETSIPAAEAERLPRDGVFGAGAVEAVLNERLPMNAAQVG